MCDTQCKHNTLIWGCEDGRNLPIDRIEDLHLANIYHHVRTQYPYPRYVRDAIRDEVERRKLPQSFIEGAPYPFYDNIEKKWKKWNRKRCSSVEME